MASNDEPGDALYRELASLRNANAQLEADLAEARRRPAADLEAAAAFARKGGDSEAPAVDLVPVRDMRVEEADRVEAALRAVDVCEVRLWAQPWYAGLGRRHSVTLTLREGKGEVHGESLHAAIEAARRSEP